MKEKISLITNLITKPVLGLGYEIIRVKLIDDLGISALQIMIEHCNSNQDITVKDCKKVSKIISDLLNQNDPFDFEYNIEISSPGIDRPLTRLKDFQRYIGFEAKFKFSEAIDSFKKFKAIIDEVNGDNIKLTITENTRQIEINFNVIESANLIFTDKLVKTTRT